MASRLLTEAGDVLLLESGSAFVLEQSVPDGSGGARGKGQKPPKEPKPPKPPKVINGPFLDEEELVLALIGCGPHSNHPFCS